MSRGGPTATLPPSKEATVDVLTTQWQMLMLGLEFAVGVTAVWLYLESTGS